MAQALGCIVSIAGLAFVVGLVGSMVSGGDWSQHVGSGALVAAMAGVAAAILCLADYERHHATIRKVRGRLLAREDVDVNVFAQAARDSNQEVWLDVRCALAKFFDVPTEKIHPTDTLSDFQYQDLMPGLATFVLTTVLEGRTANSDVVVYPAQEDKTLLDFGDMIQQSVGPAEGPAAQEG